MKQQINESYLQYYLKISQFLPKKTPFFTLSSGKIENVPELKLNFCSSSFIVYCTNVKILWLHVEVFSRHDILHF